MNLNNHSGRFIIGAIMFIAGLYLFLSAVHVNHYFSMGHRIMNVGNTSITSGYVMIPFIFGIGMIFYNAKNILGWVLAAGSLALLIFGVITSIDFTLRSMTAFELIMILVLMVGGLGMFLSSLRGGGSSS